MDMFANAMAAGAGQHFQGHGPQYFATTLRCHSAAVLDKEHVENGGKIVLPPSCLDKMSQLDLVYPLLFELQKAHPSPNAGALGAKRAHCGVLEFSAEEGRMYVPFWMMRDMCVEEGELVYLKTVTLPKGNFVKLQPESTAFIEISNPRAVLENVLRNFAALGEGETICIKYNNTDYWLRILEVKPQHPTRAISIVDTDVNVEFAAPLDYVEPEPTPGSQAAAATAAQGTAGGLSQSSGQIRVHMDSDSDSGDEGGAWRPFASQGQSISGKAPRRRGSPAGSPLGQQKGVGGGGGGQRLGSSQRLGVAHEDSDSDSGEDTKKPFKAFSGAGHSLRG